MKNVAYARYIKMSLRVKVWDLKRAVKYYSLYRGARYIDARYSERIKKNVHMTVFKLISLLN